MLRIAMGMLMVLGLSAMEDLAAQAPAVPADAPAAAPAPPAPASPARVSYKQEPDLDPKGERNKLTALRNAKDSVVKGQSTFAQQQAQIKEYYENQFRSMTRIDRLAGMERFHRGITGDLAANNPELSRYIRAEGLTFMKSVVDPKNNYHPASKYAAALVLGNLNTNEALAVLVQEIGNPQQIDAVRVGALVGILRYAELARVPGAQPVPDSAKEAIRKSMISLALARQVPETRAVDAHQWMRRRSLEILGTLGFAGPQGKESLVAVAEVLGDPAAPFAVRLSAAEGLGVTKVESSDAQINTQLLKGLGSLAAHVCFDEVKRAAKLLTSGYEFEGAGGGYGGGGMRMEGGPGMPGGMPGGGYGRGGMRGAQGGRGGAYGGGYGYGAAAGGRGGSSRAVVGPDGKKIADPELLRFRRRLIHTLSILRQSLAAIMNEPQKDLIANFDKALADILKKLSGKADKTDPAGEEEPRFDKVVKAVDTLRIGSLHAAITALYRPEGAAPAATEEAPAESDSDSA